MLAEVPLPPPGSHQVVETLAGDSAQCNITRYRDDDSEAGDRISVKCGNRVYALPNAQKGLSIDKISVCRAVILIHGVHFPKLIEISNCGTSVRITNVGELWLRRLAVSHRVTYSNIEYVFYENVKKKMECYRVSIEYVRDENRIGAFFRVISSIYCVR